MTGELGVTAELTPDTHRQTDGRFQFFSCIFFVKFGSIFVHFAVTGASRRHLERRYENRHQKVKIISPFWKAFGSNFGHISVFFWSLFLMCFFWIPFMEGSEKVPFGSHFGVFLVTPSP